VKLSLDFTTIYFLIYRILCHKVIYILYEPVNSDVMGQFVMVHEFSYRGRYFSEDSQWFADTVLSYKFPKAYFCRVHFDLKENKTGKGVQYNIQSYQRRYLRYL
jgi:hypothetical protein